VSCHLDLVPSRPRPRRRARPLPARAMGAGRPAARPRRCWAAEPRRGGRSPSRRAIELPGAGAVAERVPTAAAGRHRRGAGQSWLCRDGGQPHLRAGGDSLRRRPRRRGQPGRAGWGPGAPDRPISGAVPPTGRGLRLQGRRPGLGGRPARAASRRRGRAGPAGIAVAGRAPRVRPVRRRRGRGGGRPPTSPHTTPKSRSPSTAGGRCTAMPVPATPCRSRGQLM
jgi:hypothetical protein